MIQTSVNKFNPSDIEPMRKEYKSKTKATLSCGIGSTPEEAMKAIVIAKNTGKNKAVFWEDSMESTYKKVVKDRIDNLKTKLRAAGGRVMESEGNISPEMKKHVRKELRRLLKQRKAKNKRLDAKKSSTASWPRRRPVKPNPAAQERKKKATAMHQPKMVSLMRSFILKHRAAHRDGMRKAHTLHLMGYEKEAHAIRAVEKLRYKKMLKDRDVLHTAASLRDPAHLPASIRKSVSNIRDTMASRVKATRKEARKLGLKKAIEKLRVAKGQLKSKPADRNISTKTVPGAKAAKKPTPEPVKPVHPEHTPDTPKTPKLKKSPAGAPKFLNPNKPANKFRKRGY